MRSPTLASMHTWYDMNASSHRFVQPPRDALGARTPSKNNNNKNAIERERVSERDRAKNHRNEFYDKFT